VIHAIDNDRSCVSITTHMQRHDNVRACPSITTDDTQARTVKLSMASLTRGSWLYYLEIGGRIHPLEWPLVYIIFPALVFWMAPESLQEMCVAPNACNVCHCPTCVCCSMRPKGTCYTCRCVCRLLATNRMP
jgi:hypothetical protein